MKSLSIAIVCLLLSGTANAQRLLSWTPEFPSDNSALTFTVDCNKGNQGLLNFEGGSSANVYVHVGVLTNLSTGATDWKYVKFTYGSTDPAAKATALGNNKYSYTINNIRTFFGVPAGETIRTVNVIFRNASGNLKQVNSDVSDMYIPVYGSSQFAVRLNLPPFEPRYIPWVEPINATVGSTISIAGVSSSNAALSLTLNGNSIATVANGSSIAATPVLTTACEQKVILTGNNGTTTSKDSFSFYIAPAVTTAPLPAGLQDGINYGANNTEVTLVLYAPTKTSAVVIGDFSNWQTNCAYQMTKTPDGNRFFIKLTGLTPGTIYKFQYIVDGTIKTTDPYTELVLDQNNDPFISSTTYPNLPAYPTGLTTGIVGTFQTAAPSYTWTNNNFARPDKKNLVIYELLVRDFLSASNWQTLTDTLNYIRNLGVNAIEIMPFNEFEGNISWGYNPDFFFAPDKAYGTKNNLKRFIDMAHGMGMAVIMDAVLNHATGLSPLAQLYWNSSTNQPASNSPYFNVTATHPFSVFNDFNHESEATKYHTARYIRHWLTEYKLDGFRWDLSKGFTQHVTTDVNAWNTYDASRVAIWQRYYDSTQSISPGSYDILEHLGNDDEEADLSSRGMLLWGKMTDQYNQNTMGYITGSDISRAFYKNRAGWTQPHLVTYAESHDEERIMYKNLTFGNSTNTNHNVKTLPVALLRTEAMQPFLLLIPGPKMIWQFGELGYDKSIFQCEDGTVPSPYGTDNCKTNPKPILWNYYADAARKRIYDVIAALNRLRALKPNAFLSNAVGGTLGNDLKKSLIINHPDLQLVAMGNFDVTAQDITVTFPGSGTWYNYFSGATFSATGSAQTINLQPGDYRVFVNQSFCSTAAPTVTSPVNYCQNATAVPLAATGTNLLWYTTATGGTGSSTAPTPITTTVGTTAYYVSQNTGCESIRAAIIVNVNALPAAPAVVSPLAYCQNATAPALTATGTNLLWYTTATGGTGTATAPIPSTAAIGSTSYYVSQTNGSCESPRATITVTITATTPAPVVTSPVNYCQNATAVPLSATGTNLLWYTTATGGTGSSTAPTPVTSATGATIYYVGQTQSCGESPRAAITVNVNTVPVAPAATTPVSYCQNVTATALTATGTGLLWYSTATGGTASATAPVPSTTTAGATNYYVSQTSGSCESPRTTITVNINAAPAAPVVTAAITYCQNAASTALTATGTSLLWYSAATGGTGSSTAPVPSTTTAGTTNYYVSQTAGTCESPRAVIAVTVNPLPAAATVTTPVTYCKNSAAAALSATGSELLWYTSATGGTGTSAAPVPPTTNAGTTAYYVAQSNACGEGPRTMISVVVTPAPATTSNLTVSAVSNTGATLNWAAQTGILYTVQYRQAGTASWNIAVSGTSANSTVVSGLMQGLTYEWQVSANCSAANSNVYTNGPAFTTNARDNGITNNRNGIGIKISPNPVNGNAVIDYSMNGYGRVTIVVIDPQGKIVKRLLDESKVAGQYHLSVTTAFNNLSAGTYFLRVQQNDQSNYLPFVKQQ